MERGVSAPSIDLLAGSAQDTEPADPAPRCLALWPRKKRKEGGKKRPLSSSLPQFCHWLKQVDKMTLPFAWDECQPWRSRQEAAISAGGLRGLVVRSRRPWTRRRHRRGRALIFTEHWPAAHGEFYVCASPTAELRPLSLCYELGKKNKTLPESTVLALHQCHLWSLSYSLSLIWPPAPSLCSL